MRGMILALGQNNFFLVALNIKSSTEVTSNVAHGPSTFRPLRQWVSGPEF